LSLLQSVEHSRLGPQKEALAGQSLSFRHPTQLKVSSSQSRQGWFGPMQSTQTPREVSHLLGPPVEAQSASLPQLAVL